MFANIFVGALRRGRVGTFYGITMLYRKDPRPLLEDLPKIFALLAAKKIDPLVQTTFPLVEARQAIELLASGSVQGKIVLTNGSFGEPAKHGRMTSTSTRVGDAYHASDFLVDRPLGDYPETLALYRKRAGEIEMAPRGPGRRAFDTAV
jgi:hypothetical protein